MTKFLTHWSFWAVQGAKVTAVVEAKTKAPKVIVFKKKRRKGYRRWNGHRQDVTSLRILDVVVPESMRH